MNHYEMLGVRVDATPMEIEAAYQTILKSLPKVTQADELLEIDLSLIYQTLMNPYSRQLYDKQCAFLHRRVQEEGERADGRKIDLVVYDAPKAKESAAGFQERMQMNTQVNHNYYNNYRNYPQEVSHTQLVSPKADEAASFLIYLAMGVAVVAMTLPLIF